MSTVLFKKMFNDENYVQGDQNVRVPAHLNFGKYMLDCLRRKSDEVVLENPETCEKLTYKEFTQYCVDFSVSLTKLGVRKGDVVAVGSEKRILFMPTALAIVFTGATYTPYDIKSGKSVLKHKMEISKPAYFICTKQFWETNSEVLKSFDGIKKIISFDDDFVLESWLSVKSLTSEHHDVNLFEPSPVQGQTDTAIVLYSSGTTGMPKGVQLTHLNCILNSLPDDYKDDSLQTAFLKGNWFHNYDNFLTYKYIALGRKIVFIENVTPVTVLETVEKHQINIIFTDPALVNLLSKLEDKHKFNIDSLKTVYSRSSTLHVKTVESFNRRFPSIKNLLQGYGMTESGELTSENWATKGPKPGSVGMASPGITLKVVDLETQKPLGPNQRGEICLRGPVFMKGYIGIDPSSYLDEEGFLKTGDMGYYDEDGYFYIIDRLKDIIMNCGANVSPLELETILLLHPGVREAGVVGKPDPVAGELPAAFVVKQPGSNVTEQELMDFISDEVPPYMELTGGIRFISEIPRNSRGKVLRKNLREMLNE